MKQEEYLKNREKKCEIKVIWDDREKMTPNELIECINGEKEEILRSGMGVDESSISVNIDTDYNESPLLYMRWERWETMEEYKRRKELEVFQHEHDLRRLRIDISKHFEDACAIVDELRKKKSEE